MKKYIILAISSLMLTVSLQAQTKEEKKQLKKEQAKKEYLATKELVETHGFTFVALQTTPLGGPRVFLNTIPHYVHIDNEQGDIYLPYFGAVRAGTGYSAEGGIKYKGQLENYQVTFDDEKLRIQITFEAQKKLERFEFNFNIYHGASATLVVASSKRNSISYNGQLRELEKPMTN